MCAGAEAAPPRADLGLTVGLGAAQLIAWGTLYYGVATWCPAMAADLGLEPSHVFAASSWSLWVSGLLAPWAGRLVDRAGPRAVLLGSTGVGALGLFALAHVEGWLGLAAASCVIGAAMALGLYDTCFAAIGLLTPSGYRRVVSGVSLLGGFASTVSWPCGHALVQTWGWRRACELYAVALLACAVAYALTLPKLRDRPVRAWRVGHAPVLAATPVQAARLGWALAGASFVGSAVSAHLIGLLQGLAHPAADAVWIGASLGGLQVAGRLVELALGPRLGPRRLAAASFAGSCAALLLLATLGAEPLAAYGFVLLYGMSHGLFTIARATLPIDLFGFEQVGTRLGRFAAPSALARALGPLFGALLLAAVGARWAILALFGVSVGAFVLLTYRPAHRVGSAMPSSAKRGV